MTGLSTTPVSGMPRVPSPTLVGPSATGAVRGAPSGAVVTPVPDAAAYASTVGPLTTTHASALVTQLEGTDA